LLIEWTNIELRLTDVGIVEPLGIFLNEAAASRYTVTERIV
jgi:hypothetical protein